MKIIAPTSCPSCNTKLEKVVTEIAVTLMCPNKITCPAQTGKRLEKFCKALSVKGFGPATLAKVPATTIPELLSLTVEDFINSGYSDLMANKLHTELLNKTTKMPMDKFLEGLAIPTFGATASKAVATEVSSLAEAFTKKGLVSPRLTDILQEFSIENPWIFDLEDRVVTGLPAPVSAVEPNGRVVVITGSLNNYKNRTEAGKFLESHGYIVKSSVTKATDFLVCEDETKTSSSSYKKATELGIKIITNINYLVENK